MMNRKVLIRVSCSEYSDWSDATKRKGSEMFRQQKLNFFSPNWICFFKIIIDEQIDLCVSDWENTGAFQ